MSAGEIIGFPPGFFWGTATSAYQIEGAANEDGRGLSIWDVFSRTPGKIKDGQTGERGADHYHRWREDVDLMAQMGLNAYRFSVAWPRIQPQGSGAPNNPGLDFYDRLVDALLEKGIQPFLTLYHWDLPQALQERGGWAARETAERFGEYAGILASRLGDRVNYWITHNEPWVMAMAGHFAGEHAPGLQDPQTAGRAVHHLLLSHGLAVQAIRSASGRPVKVGITLNLNPVHPASDTEEDRQAAARFDLILNRLFLEPIFKGSYPEDALSLLSSFFPETQPEDLKTISVPLDFLGANYYSRAVVRYDPDFPVIQASQVQPEGSEYSQMWEIYPPGMDELLERLHNEFYSGDIFVTENGIPVPDAPDFDGRVRDYRRIRYLYDHLVQVHKAIQAGVPVKGYLVWSLMDNFEWAFGYTMRFGLIYIDYETMQRTLKESAYWFSQVAKQNGISKLA